MLIQHRIFAVLVVVVFVHLPRVIRRIAENHEDRRGLLGFHPLRVFRRHEIELLLLRVCQLERVHEADAGKRRVAAGARVIFVFDVHGRDVIRQQHDLVAVEFAGVFRRQRGRVQLAHDLREKIPRADERIENVNIRRGKPVCQAKFGFQDFFDRVDHELHDRLRRIHDAVRVGHFDRKTLKEALIDRVEKALLFREIAQRGGRRLDGVIKAVKRLEIDRAPAVRLHEGEDDLFDFVRDDVQVDEIRVVEHLREDALGQDVLNQHFFDRRNGNVRVDVVAADRDEVVKRGQKVGVFGLPLAFDELHQPRADLFDLPGKLLDGLPPFVIHRRRVFEKRPQRGDQRVRPREIPVIDILAVLPENRPLRRLKEDIVFRVARREFLLDLARQIVRVVFRLPDAVHEVELIRNRAVEKERFAPFLRGVLLDERPVELRGAMAQQRGKHRRDGAFFQSVSARLRREFGEVVVIRRNDFLRGFQIKRSHDDGVSRAPTNSPVRRGCAADKAVRRHGKRASECYFSCVASLVNAASSSGVKPVSSQISSAAYPRANILRAVAFSPSARPSARPSAFMISSVSAMLA